MSDKSLAAVCSDAMLKPGVAGVLVVDAQGLLLASDGAVPEASGAVAELAAQAQALCGNDASVSVESAKTKVLLSRSGGVTTALFMSPAAPAS